MSTSPDDGDWLHGHDELRRGYRSQFDEIRSTIDEIVSPWRDLPDPRTITPVIDSCRRMTIRLAGTATDLGGEAMGVGLFPGYLAVLNQNCAAMSGATIEAFKSKFIGQLGGTIGGLHVISLVRGGAIAAERGMWEQAPDQVAEILREITKGFADLRTRNVLKWQHVIDCVGWAVKGLELFSAGALAPLKVAALGIELARAAAGSKKVDAEVGSYAEGIALLQKLLRTLNKQITAEEQLIADNMKANLRGISQHKSSFDLSQFPLPPESDTIDPQGDRPRRSRGEHRGARGGAAGGLNGGAPAVVNGDAGWRTARGAAVCPENESNRSFYS